MQFFLNQNREILALWLDNLADFCEKLPFFVYVNLENVEATETLMVFQICTSGINFESK